jgi:hypothetical protein
MIYEHSMLCTCDKVSDTKWLIHIWLDKPPFYAKKHLRSEWRGYKTCEIFLLCMHQLEEKNKNGNKKQLPLETKDQKQIQKKT